MIQLADAEITNKAIKSSLAGGPGPAFANFISIFWRLSLIFAGLAVFIYFIWGSFEWLTAGGESDKVSKAQKRMTNAVIGFIVLLSVVAFLKFIMPLIGLNIFCPLNWQDLKFECH